VAAFEKLDESCEDLGAREAGEFEVAADLGADFGDRSPELDHLVEFVFVAEFPPAGVISVLPAAALVDADGLDMASWVGGDDHVFPGWGDHEGVDSVEGGFLSDGLAGTGDIFEAVTGAEALDAGGDR
jgi:hypothetical protein